MNREFVAAESGIASFVEALRIGASVRLTRLSREVAMERKVQRWGRFSRDSVCLRVETRWTAQAIPWASGIEAQGADRHPGVSAVGKRRRVKSTESPKDFHDTDALWDADILRLLLAESARLRSCAGAQRRQGRSGCCP